MHVCVAIVSASRAARSSAVGRPGLKTILGRPVDGTLRGHAKPCFEGSQKRYK